MRDGFQDNGYQTMEEKQETNEASPTIYLVY